MYVKKLKSVCENVEEFMGKGWSVWEKDEDEVKRMNSANVMDEELK